jgi:sugar lactone lactonase YvrE
MNDAKCDAVGRLWAGSTELEFKAGQGKLHRLNPDLSHETILTGLTLPNGLGWNPANTVFYLVDSMERVLWAFDYDLATGDISNKRVFFDFQSIDGLADGLCVSDDGTIFVAIWDGACILLISEEGELLDKIDLPVLRPTSCCFGGDGCRDLIVTTASVEMNLTKQPESGKLLRLSGIGKRGLKSFLFET